MALERLEQVINEVIIALQKGDSGEIREKEAEFSEVFFGVTKNYFWSIGRSTGLTKSEIEGCVLCGVFDTLRTIRSRVRRAENLNEITPGYVRRLIWLRSLGAIKEDKSPLYEPRIQSIEDPDAWAFRDLDTPEEILIAKETVARKQEEKPASGRTFLEIFKEIWLDTDRQREFRRRLVRAPVRLKLFDRWAMEFEGHRSEEDDELNRRVIQWWLQLCGAMDRVIKKEELDQIRNRYDQGKLRLEGDMVKYLHALDRL